jgi:predicted lipoprotein with Yx(FWY)xxD motif
MTRSRPIAFLATAAVIPLIALTVAACGGGGGATAATVAPPKTSTGASATVGVANSSLGSILVDSAGQTLYLFKADAGTKSACSGPCASAFGAAWFALSPSGSQISATPPSAANGGASSGGGGY